MKGTQFNTFILLVDIITKETRSYTQRWLGWIIPTTHKKKKKSTTSFFPLTSIFRLCSHVWDQDSHFRQFIFHKLRSPLKCLYYVRLFDYFHAYI